MRYHWLLVALPLVAFSAFAQESEPLKFELPEPSFGGTPPDYYSKILEPESYKAREPFLAPKGTHVISKGAPVSSSVPPNLGQLAQITDGDKAFGKKSIVELPGGTQWVQLDLGQDKSLYVVLFWHWHEAKRAYFDIIVQASNDAEFKKDVSTLYNNDADNSSGLGIGSDKEYYETNQGRLVDAKGMKARYLRVYGRGNHQNDFTHFIEVEVWGK